MNEKPLLNTLLSFSRPRLCAGGHKKNNNRISTAPICHVVVTPEALDVDYSNQTNISPRLNTFTIKAAALAQW